MIFDLIRQIPGLTADEIELFDLIFASDKDMIEKERIIDGKECYGTNNPLMVKFLAERGTVPLKSQKEDEVTIHYYEKTPEFEAIMPFYRDMATGGLLPWMIEYTDKKKLDQRFMDRIPPSI